MAQPKLLSFDFCVLNFKFYYMPELPEVETVARELNRKLKKRKIKSVEVKAPKMISLGPDVVSNIRKVKSSQVQKFERLLRNQIFESVKRRAKLLIFNFSRPRVFSPNFGKRKKERASLSLLVHLKMTGQFIFEDTKLRSQTHGRYCLINKASAPKELLPCRHTHVIFNFMDGSILYFNDVRKFGYLKLVRDNEISQVRELREFGPEPLSKQYTIGRFLTAVKKCPKRTIKSMLVDPKVVAGIGNIYSDEILFHAGLRPTRKVLKISNQELGRIYINIKKVLTKAVKAKGSSVGDFVRTDGSWGQMGKYHFVYGRSGQKCKRCASIISSVKLNGRTGSFCPKCQK